jgi:hypothetical protein
VGEVVGRGAGRRGGGRGRPPRAPAGPAAAGAARRRGRARSGGAGARPAAPRGPRLALAVAEVQRQHDLLEQEARQRRGRAGVRVKGSGWEGGGGLGWNVGRGGQGGVIVRACRAVGGTPQGGQARPPARRSAVRPPRAGPRAPRPPRPTPPPRASPRGAPWAHASPAARVCEEALQVLALDILHHHAQVARRKEHLPGRGRGRGRGFGGVELAAC